MIGKRARRKIGECTVKWKLENGYLSSTSLFAQENRIGKHLELVA
jgi:hypothetical protein